MKRSAQLSSLSREHHVALEVALLLRKATAGDAGVVRERFVRFFQEEAREHFRAEEELVLPAFARYVSSEDPDIVRVLTDHVELRRRAGDLAGGAADLGELHALGNLLHDHVRHEERRLFPRIEAALAGEELAELGAVLDAQGETHTPPRL